MKLTITHKNECICELESIDVTKPELWDNLVTEAINYANHLHAVEGGRTTIILESETAPTV